MNIQAQNTDEIVERRWRTRSELIGRWGFTWDEIKSKPLDWLESTLADEQEMWAIGEAERRSELALFGYELSR